MDTIDEKLKIGKNDEAIRETYKKGYPNLGYLLGTLIGFSQEYLNSLESLTRFSYTQISLHCNWLGPGQLVRLWEKMGKEKGVWNKILLTTNSSEAKYHIIINSTAEKIDFSKSILFQMEPNMENNPQQWGYWASPNEKDFLKIFTHKNSFNNCEWHLSSTYAQLQNSPQKNPDLQGIISTVLSDKYYDPGHKKRVDFAKFLDTKDVPLHVFGSNLGYKHYKGFLSYHNKDDALLPYFYTFNVENQFINNYFTEKIIDGILSECLTFYHGPKNIRDYFDERAFVWLELEDFEADYNLIKTVISEDWRTLRLPYIKKEKEKILNKMQFFPRIENIIKEIENSSQE